MTDRYRISADDLDDHAGRPEGAPLTTGHDPAPPPDAPAVWSRTSPSTGVTSYEMALTSEEARDRRPGSRTARRLLSTAALAVTVAALVIPWVRG